METVPIALGIATLVVAVLLMSCWDKKPKGSATSRRSPQVVVLKDIDPDDDSHQRSEWGSGKKNAQLARQYNDLANMDGYNDYADVTKYQSLDPEVFESHDNYADQIGVSNNGASNLAVRSDPNDVVPWVGLRRPDYHSIYAGKDARVVHSEYADQQFAKTTYGGC
jgi:hypothetical protein